MSFVLERKLIESAFKAGMPTNSPIEFENDKFTAPANGYTRLSVLSGGEGRLLAIGATGQSRTPGLIDVAIFVKPESGTAGARATADLIAGALANQTLTEGFVRITTFGAHLDLIGRAGDWYQANVTIRYQRDSQ